MIRVFQFDPCYRGWRSLRKCYELIKIGGWILLTFCLLYLSFTARQLIISYQIGWHASKDSSSRCQYGLFDKLWY